MSDEPDMTHPVWLFCNTCA